MVMNSRQVWLVLRLFLFLKKRAHDTVSLVAAAKMLISTEGVMRNCARPHVRGSCHAAPTHHQVDLDSKLRSQNAKTSKLRFHCNLLLFDQLGRLPRSSTTTLGCVVRERRIEPGSRWLHVQAKTSQFHRRLLRQPRIRRHRAVRVSGPSHASVEPDGAGGAKVHTLLRDRRRLHPLEKQSDDGLLFATRRDARQSA